MKCKCESQSQWWQPSWMEFQTCFLRTQLHNLEEMPGQDAKWNYAIGIKETQQCNSQWKLRDSRSRRWWICIISWSSITNEWCKTSIFDRSPLWRSEASCQKPPGTKDLHYNCWVLLPCLVCCIGLYFQVKFTIHAHQVHNSHYNFWGPWALCLHGSLHA